MANWPSSVDTGLGPGVGEAEHDPLLPFHRVAVGGDLDRVLGVTEQGEQPVRGGDVLAAGGGLLADEHEDPPADERRPGPRARGKGWVGRSRTFWAA
jgi:hypothetical protein